MTYRKTVLDSGLTVLTERMDGVRSASLGLWVRTGARDERPQQAGISHFMEHMLFKGTPTRDAMQISAAFDALGAEVNAFTSRECTCFYSRMIDVHFGECFQILADMLVNASFAPDTVEPEREVVLEEIARSEDDPDDHVFDVFSQAVFPTHPLGRPVLGTREVVGGFGSEDLHAYHAQRYTAGNVFVVACGNVDHEEAVRLAQEHLAGLGEVSFAERAPFSDQEPQRLACVTKDSEQAHLVMGCPLFGAESDKRYAFQLMNSALGGGMSSRLFTEVREKRGLVYSVFSTAQLCEGAGQFMVYAGTRPENLAQVVDIVYQELGKMAREGIGQEEFERVREMVCGNYVLGMESPRSHMTRLGKMAVSGRELLTLDQTLQAYRSVTKEQVNDIAAWLLQKPMTAAVVSPYEDNELKEMILR